MLNYETWNAFVLWFWQTLSISAVLLLPVLLILVIVLSVKLRKAKSGSKESSDKHLKDLENKYAEERAKKNREILDVLDAANLFHDIPAQRMTTLTGVAVFLRRMSGESASMLQDHYLIPGLKNAAAHLNASRDHHVWPLIAEHLRDAELRERKVRIDTATAEHEATAFKRVNAAHVAASNAKDGVVIDLEKSVDRARSTRKSTDNAEIARLEGRLAESHSFNEHYKGLDIRRATKAPNSNKPNKNPADDKSADKPDDKSADKPAA